ncbi:MAG: PIG-L deacetylase family protein [Acidobacteriota bacterium]
MRRPALPEEVDLVPFEPSFPPGRRWLVLAPHPDDEVFGLGATLAIARHRGIEITLVLITDGDAQGDPVVRAQEAIQAARALDLQPPRSLHFRDRGLDRRSIPLRRVLREILAAIRPDTVFVTSPVELHPDHRALALTTQRVLRRSTWLGLRPGPSWVAAYEVGTPLVPNMLVDAGPGWAAKRAAGAAYASQLAFHPYDEIMEAFGSLRRLTLHDVSRAEAFHLLPAVEVVRRSARAWARLMGSDRGVRRRRA